MEVPSASGSAPSSARSKEKRASRACLSCRIRKTRCELDTGGGEWRTPCRRCAHERLECILMPSKRAGRRSRNVPMQSGTLDAGLPSTDHNALARQISTANYDTVQPRTWSSNATFERPATWRLSPASQFSQNLSPAESYLRKRQGGGQSRQSSESGIESHVASTDLLNPSDALKVLAQAADIDSRSPTERQPVGQMLRVNDSSQDRSSTLNNDETDSNYYPPISEGIVSLSEAYTLLKHFHAHYHPFFPLAPPAIFSGGDILYWAQKEQYLLTAILAVASKDDPAWAMIHSCCIWHMETLVSRLLRDRSAGIGAVEALLIMAEWAPQIFETSIGCGEEDQSSWMYVGIAIRLGYLQRLEQTGLEQCASKSEEDVRRRLAWAACYMSDRHVSIRLGKGFWSRGHGPSISLKASDFPSLEAQEAGTENLGLLFQAYLELNQDDCSATLRKWKLVWGGLSFTPSLKASLFLTYDFLRLYVNAFAFQAAINRIISQARSSSNPVPIVLPLRDLAEAFDARFIYESIDAANSLLGTLNSFIDPVEGLKYMPIKYYLYIIYAAVFLFKARLAGALGSEASSSVHRTISATIARLRKTSPDPTSLGHRYAQSLHLLWRESLEKDDKPGASLNDHEKVSAVMESGSRGPFMAHDVRGGSSGRGLDLNPLNGFSWKDLDSLGQFITSDPSVVAANGIVLGPGFTSQQSGESNEGDGTINMWNNVHNPIEHITF